MFAYAVCSAMLFSDNEMAAECWMVSSESLSAIEVEKCDWTQLMEWKTDWLVPLATAAFQTVRIRTLLQSYYRNDAICSSTTPRYTVHSTLIVTGLLLFVTLVAVCSLAATCCILSSLSTQQLAWTFLFSLSSFCRAQHSNNSYSRVRAISSSIRCVH